MTDVSTQGAAPEAEAPIQETTDENTPRPGFPVKKFTNTPTRRPPRKTKSNKAALAAAAMRKAESEAKAAEKAESDPAQEPVTAEAKKPEPKPEPVKKAEPVEPEPKEEPKQEKKPNEDSARFRALAQKEKRLLAVAQKNKDAIAKEREAFEQEVASSREELEDARAIQELLKTGDKYALLDHFGLDVEEWAHKTLGRKPPEKESGGQSLESQALEEMRARLDAMEKERTERESADKQAAEDREANQRYETTKTTYLDRINEIMNNESDLYGYSLAKDAAETVWEVIVHEVNSSGREMTISEALDIVESHYEKDADSYRGVSKFQTKTTPQGEARALDTPGAVGATPKSKPAAQKRIASGRLTKHERRQRFAQSF